MELKEDSIVLFLDDNPNRAALLYQRLPVSVRDVTMWVKKVEEAIEILEVYKSRLALVFLDHDLGNENYVHSGREDCGMEVVRYLEKQNPNDYKDCKFIVHSWNLPAATKMAERLTKVGYTVSQIPFGM